MERRAFCREFKIEAVKLLEDREVTVAQAARDPDVHSNGCVSGFTGRFAIPDQHFAYMAR